MAKKSKITESNPDHVALVHQGRKALSDWRHSNPRAHLNLRGADLAGVDLRSDSSQRADLVGADMSGADLRDAKLRYANLAAADLRNANLEGADLFRADLTRADAREANLKGARLGGADLGTARLTRSNLAGARMDWTKAENAILDFACLQHVDLTFGRLSGASLFGADMQGARLGGAQDLNLTNVRGYILDGHDISTWVIPPAPILPHRTGVGSWWKDWWRPWKLLTWPYSDPWSTVRRSYTGTMTAFHILLAVTAMGPYALRAVIADAGNRNLPRIAVALGWGRDDEWFLVPSGIMLVSYNVLRVFATWWLSQLREEEVRSRHAPEKGDYWWWWLAHKWFLKWAGLFSLILGFVRTWWWLSERV